MKPTEITKKDIEQRDAYYDRDTFISLVKTKMKREGIGFKEAFEVLCEEDPSYFLRFMLGAKPFAWQHQVYQDYKAGKRKIAICCSRQIGKASADSAMVLTPEGWITMSELEVGQYVYGVDGQEAEVVGKYPQGEVDIYRVWFTDGSHTDVTLDHLWVVKNAGVQSTWRVLSLKQIIETRGMNPSSDAAYRIPLVDPIQFEEKKHIVSPYELGVMLGDGYFAKKKANLSLTSNDRHIVDNIFKNCDVNISNPKKAYVVRLKGDSLNCYYDEFQRMDLIGTHSHTKFIPEEYLYDSIQNRTELLRGLMDTDGSISGNCSVEYSTTSVHLKDAVKFLVESLGGNVRIKERVSTYTYKGEKKKGKPSYRIFVRLQNINPFSLPRKADKWYNIKYERVRIMDKIEKLPNKQTASCISVDNESHTYLTDSCIVTHNTKYVVAPITLWRCVFNMGYKLNPVDRNKSRFTVECVVSLTEPQSIMVLDEIKQWIFDGDEYMASYKDTKGNPIFGKKYFSDKVDWKKTNMFNLVFKRGIGGSGGQSRIRAVPATDKIRGYTYTGQIFDECAFIDDYIIESVALPAGNAIGSSTIHISTPDKKAGHFYQAIDPDDEFPKHKYNRYMFDIESIKEDAPDYYDTVMNEVEDLKMKGKTQDVNREFYCDFTSSQNQFFDMERIQGAFTNQITPVNKYEGPVHIGIDVGGYGKSHTVITAVTDPDYKGESKRIACWRYELKKEANLIQDVEREIFPNFNVKSLTIDYCSASFILYEQMVQRGWSVNQFKFSKESKTDYYNRFREALNTGKLYTYVDKNLKSEFVAFTDDMKPITGATDDMIDSWMLACSTFLGQKTNIDVKVIGGNSDANKPLRPGEKDMFEEQIEAYNRRMNDFKGLGGAI